MTDFNTHAEFLSLLQSQDNLIHFKKPEELLSLGFIGPIEDFVYSGSMGELYRYTIENDYNVDVFVKSINGNFSIACKEFREFDTHACCRLNDKASKIIYDKYSSIKDLYFYTSNLSFENNMHYKTISYFEDMAFEEIYEDSNFFLTFIIHNAYNENEIDKAVFRIGRKDIIIEQIAQVNSKFLNLNMKELRNIQNTLSLEEINLLEMYFL